MATDLKNTIPTARKAETGSRPEQTPVLRELDVRPRQAMFTLSDPITRAALLAYAAFVLDQEAKYCQQ